MARFKVMATTPASGGVYVGNFERDGYITANLEGGKTLTVYYTTDDPDYEGPVVSWDYSTGDSLLVFLRYQSSYGPDATVESVYHIYDIYAQSSSDFDYIHVYICNNYDEDFPDDRFTEEAARARCPLVAEFSHDGEDWYLTSGGVTRSRFKIDKTFKAMGV